MNRLVFATLCISLAASAICAQTGKTSKNEFSIWGAFSPDSNTFLKATGRTRDARLGIVAFRYSRRFNNGDAINLKYTADLIPAALLNYPDIEILPTVPPAARPIRPTRYAIGIAPLGIKANFRPRKSLQPFLEASVGLLYFNKETPNYIGTRFSFTADVGGGIEFLLKEKRSISLGYKYYHISNGGRGAQNPGFDNNLFYVGYTFLTK